MKLKNTTTLGKVSFVIAIIVLIGLFYLAFGDIIFPLDLDNPNTDILSFGQHIFLIMQILQEISVVGFVIGIITLFQKQANKKLAIFTVIVSSPLALTWLYLTVLIVMFKLRML